MPEHRVAVYSAFSDTPIGGSLAGIVTGAAGLGAPALQGIARALGAPATAFVGACGDDEVEVRFFSTETEYGMCGHGTVALMTWLVDSGQIDWRGGDRRALRLRTGAGVADVELVRRAGRTRVMLDLEAPRFEPLERDPTEAAAVLGLPAGAIDPRSPPERAVAPVDFRHLIVPVDSLASMRAMRPDIPAIAAYSRRVGVDTVCAFTAETAAPEHTVHCRDFCPAVGTPESPAAGTTNRALACYLVRHGWIDAPRDTTLVVTAEQGHEMGRPSLVRSELRLQGGEVVGVRVGGVATGALA